MKGILCSTIEGLGYEIFQQGSMLDDDDYPDKFFTFWNPETDSLGIYDTGTVSDEWVFELNFYSNNPSEVQTILDSAVTALHNLGSTHDYNFISYGRGHDVFSDEKTHTGRGITLYGRKNRT